MIFSAFLYVATFILGLVLAVFPASSGLPTEYSTAIASLTGYVGMFDPIVPIATLAQAVGIVLFFEATIFAFRGTMWIYHKIPFIGK